MKKLSPIKKLIILLLGLNNFEPIINSSRLQQMIYYYILIISKNKKEKEKLLKKFNINLNKDLSEEQYNELKNHLIHLIEKLNIK